MTSIDRRIANLERLIRPPEGEGAEERKAILIAILNEISGLQACRATNGYRGGKPPTPIQPTDPAGEALGYPYTTGELAEHAIRRVLEREGVSDVEEWVGFFRQLVEAEWPPAMTPPWH